MTAWWDVVKDLLGSRVGYWLCAEHTDLGFLSDVRMCGMSASLVGLEGRWGKSLQGVI